MYFCGVVCTYHSLWGKKLWTIIYLCLHAASSTKSFILLLPSGSIVNCVCMWVLGSWSARDARANARHEKRSTGCIILKGWTAWKRLYWVKYCTVQSVQFVSLPLLGKLGTRQYFQKVSSREIAQSTEEWHKNEVVYIKIRISTCPSVLHAVTLYVLPATRQTRH
jgi:hypothetical protein